MPKVLRIINRLNLGGPTYNAAYLSKYLAPEFETMLVSGMKDDSEASSEFIVEQLGLEPVYIPNMYRELNPKLDWKTYRSVARIIKDFKPDIVHTHAAKAGAIGRLAAHHAGVPVILHTFHGHIFHSYFSGAKTRLFLEIERYLAKRSTRIIAISQIQRAELCEEFRIAPADKFEVVPLGFDLRRFQEDIPAKRQAFRKRFQVKPNEVAIGIIGRLVPVKNHRFFMEAIQKLSTLTAQPYRAFVIGDGEDREVIEQHARDLQISFSTESDTVHDQALCFTSWIKEADVAMAGLDIIALTSLNEGTPVSLIEASAAGKPIVTTNVGGIQDVVLTDVNAFITERTDVEGFAGKLKLLVEDAALREEMGKAGVSHAFEHYSYTTLVENMRELYQRLIREKGRI